MGMPTEELVRVEYNGQVWFNIVPITRTYNGLKQKSFRNNGVTSPRQGPEGSSLYLQGTHLSNNTSQTDVSVISGISAEA